MKIGIVGNQKGWTYNFVRGKILELGLSHSDIIISGGADGVDTYAQKIAKEIGCTIIIHYPKPHIPSPQRYFQRNEQIALESDVLIAFDKKSGRAGTKNTIANAEKHHKEIIKITSENEGDDKHVLCREIQRPIQERY